MTVRIATYGPRQGECNICGRIGPLTEDHTPPKGCIRIGQVEMNHVITHLNASKEIRKGRISQNGVKYRTLCARCNNYLGSNYDVALREFVNSVGMYLKSSLQLPSIMFVKAAPQKIMRAVLGHIAAQGVGRYKKGPDTAPLRDYLLDDTLPLPDWINIYYWVYPYRSQVIVRDCCYLDLQHQHQFLIWLLKFFPMAFLVSWNEPADDHFTVPNLGRWRDSLVHEEIELPLLLSPVIDQFWPEAPTDHSVLVYGQEAIIAMERAAKADAKVPSSGE